MIDRQEFAEELKLRGHVRKTIKVVKERKARGRRIVEHQENELRGIISNLIQETQTAVSNSAKHANTGINSLEDLLKNSNTLSVLEKGYKSLTTDPSQRKSYRNHILVAIEKSLAPEESRKEAGDEIVTPLHEEIEEDINLDLNRPEDDPAFIDIEEKPAASDEDVAREGFALSGEDKTGRNKAFTDFQNIEKVILRVFDDLDNPEDRSLFAEYLIKNLALYFDKFESELEATVEEPAAARDAEPAMIPGEDDEDIANIELQEIMKHLDVDDIIKNLL